MFIQYFVFVLDTLSGRINTPKDSDIIKAVIINILEHSKS